MNEHTKIRSISNREELDTVFAIVGEVFPVGRDYFERRLVHDSTYDPKTTWVATVDGTIASTVQIFPFSIRVEETELKVGGIGSVATLPDYRGQGLSQGILKQISHWMKEQEYDLSLLFAAITPFYEKSGWNIVPEPYYELKIDSIPALDEPSAYRIVPYEHGHAEPHAQIYEQFNKNRTYSVVRPASYWTDRHNWQQWEKTIAFTAEKNGVPVAYMYLSEPQEQVVQMEELCYLPGEEQAAYALLRAGVKHIKGKAKTLQAKLPDDHIVLPAFREWGAEQKALTYAMWKVLRWEALFHKLASVLERRAQSLSGSVFLHLECAGQHVYLSIENGHLSITGSPRPEANYTTVQLSQKAFITMLLRGAEACSDPNLHTDLLRTLFPKQNSIYYATDKF